MTGPTLEQRVAALEDLAGIPPMTATMPPLSEEDRENWKRALDAALAKTPYEYKLLPGPVPLTPEQIRQFLLNHVTVVRPGETLIIRAWADMTPSQIQEVAEWLNYVRDDGTPLLPFRTVVVPGDALGIVSDEVVQESLRALVRDELDAALVRADRAAVTDDDLDGS